MLPDDKPNLIDVVYGVAFFVVAVAIVFSTFAPFIVQLVVDAVQEIRATFPRK